MLRRAHDEAPAYRETVPADALRRGFLTKTDQSYWFVYNDNAFATYLLAMVLDGDIIDTLKAKDLLTYLKTPNSTIRFHRSGKGGVEKARAYFKISGAQPQISPYGYTVAHIFDVNDHYYDKKMGFNNTRGDQALQSTNVKIDRGMYSHYTLKGTIAGKDIYYREGYHVGSDARRFLEAHMLRFLHPLNYFCAPKDNMSGYTYCEFTDHVHTERGSHTYRRFHRISGYEHLLYYAHHKFKEKYGDIYDDFLTRIMLPENTFDFFEKSIANAEYYGDEIIDVKYGNPLSHGSKTTTGSRISSAGTGSYKGRKRGYSIALVDFDTYSPSGYSSFIRTIMRELSVADICELEARIDEMIVYCTNEMTSAKKSGDKRREKYYSNYRSALRKYKEFMDSKKIAP